MFVNWVHKFISLNNNLQHMLIG